MKKALLCLLLLSVAVGVEAQRIIITYGLVPTLGAAFMPEHGFLGGKKFKIYPAIGKHDLGGLKLRIELRDVRDSLKLQKVDCSPVEFTNTSEFVGPGGAHVVAEYLDSLFTGANCVVDSTADDVLHVTLEGMDARLIGFGSITAHGLCQMSVQWKNFSHTYCVDITDKDPHSPISSHAFVTRKTGTRIIMSAGIQEAVERMLTDMEGVK
jgi:hypothetical protein